MPQVIDLLTRFAAALAIAIVSIGFVAFVGAVVLWSRFEAAQLPADQAVALQPRADLVTVGAIALVLFVVGGLVAVLLLRLLDPGGAATLRTRRGLLLVIALEVTAAFVVEEWGKWEWLGLALLAVAALVGLGALFEQGAWWHRQHPDRTLELLLARIRAVFLTGVPEVRRRRLWIGLALIVAATVVVAAGGPRDEAYVIAAAIGVLAVAVLMVDVRPVGLVAEGPARSWAIVLINLGLVAAAFAAMGRQSWWVAVVAAIAVVLALVNLAIAHLTGDRFVWYGVAVFVSIILFGTAFNFLRALEDPQGQGLALVRTNDAEPVCGLYIGENDERLYYARIDLEGTGNRRRLRDDSGRLLWVDRERLVASEIGPLESIDAAQARAIALREEIALNREPSTQGGTLSTTLPAKPPREAQGRDPCNAVRTPAAQLLTPERELAQQFQPRLRLSTEDGFWPVSLLTIFDLKRRGKVLCRRPVCVPVLSAGDVPFRGGETEWLEYPADFGETDQQRRSTIDALGSSDPYRTAREYFLVAGAGPDKIASLQYWFFYTFNYQPLALAGLPVGRAGFHEGDFEHVGVLLSGERRPVAVWMARHDDEGRVFLWDEPVLNRQEGHVEVHVARGSHASYESCFEQARRKAPFGFINDRPECRGTRQVVLEPGQVPLLNLAQARWACWGGRFGHTRPGESRLEFELREANGPRSPLWQQSYDGESRPCEGLEPVQPIPSEGEEPLGVDAAQHIQTKSGRLERLIDECDDWQRPQAQGAYVVACDQDGLRSWVEGNLDQHDGPPLRVLTPREDAKTGEARPVAVRRFATVPSFAGWRLLSDADATIDVYASCLVGQSAVEATFRGVPIAAGQELTLDDRSPRRWRILRGRTQVAAATPTLAPEAKDGPNRAVGAAAPDTRCR